MWGGSPDRNMVSDATQVSLEFDLEEAVNVNWSANLGSQTYGNPTVADGRVYVGTNNGAGHREKYSADVDLGVLLLFLMRNRAIFSGNLAVRNFLLAASTIGRFKEFAQRLS